LPSGLVTGLVRFFLVALAADARADGSAETVYTCKETHEEQPGRGKHHQEPPSEPCAGATLVCAKLFPLIMLYGCDAHPEAKSLILRLTVANGCATCPSTLPSSSSQLTELRAALK